MDTESVLTCKKCNRELQLTTAGLICLICEYRTDLKANKTHGLITDRRERRCLKCDRRFLSINGRRMCLVCRSEAIRDSQGSLFTS
jgi:Zn finger protein HypA/HybF involved in hydrogenase expression